MTRQALGSSSAGGADHDPRRRLARDGGPRVRGHPSGNDRRHGSTTRRRWPERSRNSLIVGDLPWMSYHVSPSETVQNAAALIRAGAQCVKLEGGAQAGRHDRSDWSMRRSRSWAISASRLSRCTRWGDSRFRRRSSADALGAGGGSQGPWNTPGASLIVLEGVPDVVARKW
jgi:hypothetical protein